MKYIKKLLIPAFHTANLILITFYLYPGSIFGQILHGNSSIQPQLTRDFIISSNHLYVFIVLSTLGIIAYQNTKKIKFIIIYLLFLSIILELFHLIVPNRRFEMSDLFGNIIGVILVIIIYKVKDRHV
jgi:VanZ family protein